MSLTLIHLAYLILGLCMCGSYTDTKNLFDNEIIEPYIRINAQIDEIRSQNDDTMNIHDDEVDSQRNDEIMLKSGMESQMEKEKLPTQMGGEVFQDETGGLSNNRDTPSSSDSEKEEKIHQSQYFWYTPPNTIHQSNSLRIVINDYLGVSEK